MEGDTPVVVRALEGGPCAGAGVQAGDRIVAIDTVPTAGEAFGTIVMRLRGAPGSQVEIELVREGARRSLLVQRHAMQKSAQDYRAN